MTNKRSLDEIENYYTRDKNATKLENNPCDQ